MVSIIVPIYNVAPYLRQCLDSILAQTYRDIEVILVDDGSTDGCSDIVDEYAGLDCRIRAVHQSNTGLSGARNAGLHLATGEYVWFVDSDDYIAPEACEKLLSVTENGQYDVVIFSRQRFTDQGQVWKDRLPEECFESGKEYIQTHLSGKFSHSACHKLCKRSLIEKNDIYFASGLYEDCYFSFRLLYKAQKVKVISDILYFYRIRRPASIVSTINEQDTDVLLTIERLEQWLNENNDQDINKNAFKIYVYDWIFTSIVTKYPCKILFHRQSHQITQSIMKDPRFNRYLKAVASMPSAGWVRRIAAWMMDHCYPIFAVSVYTLYQVKHLND